MLRFFSEVAKQHDDSKEKEKKPVELKVFDRSTHSFVDNFSSELDEEEIEIKPYYPNNDFLDQGSFSQPADNEEGDATKSNLNTESSAQALPSTADLSSNSQSFFSQAAALQFAIIRHPDFPASYRDLKFERDALADEGYYIKHPIAPGGPTMRSK